MWMTAKATVEKWMSQSQEKNVLDGFKIHIYQQPIFQN